MISFLYYVKLYYQINNTWFEYITIFHPSVMDV